MARRVVLVAGGFIATLVLVVVAAAIVIVASAPGHAVARRLAVEALRGAVDGRVTIGSLGGSLWRAAELKDVELATPDGRPVIRVARVSVRYALADLVRGRVVLSRVDLDHPTVMLERLPDGHLTLEHLFRLLGPARGGRTSSWTRCASRAARWWCGTSRTIRRGERPASGASPGSTSRRRMSCSRAPTRRGCGLIFATSRRR